MATWPAELKPQACYLYGGGLGSALVAAAIERGWTVEPSPHIAFRTASAARRLYMRPPLAPLAYVACWEDEDALSRVGGNYARGAVEDELWPWLKQMGFADDRDDPVLLRFLDEFLGNWPANMRPGLRFHREWSSPKRPNSAPRSLKRSAVSSMPCSPLRISRRCRPQRPDLGALPSSTGNPPVRKPRPVQRPSGAGRMGLRGRRSLLRRTRRQEIRPCRPPQPRYRDPGPLAHQQRRRPLPNAYATASKRSSAPPLTCALTQLGFDASRAVGAGARRLAPAREFIAGRAAAWTRWLAPGDRYGVFVLCRSGPAGSRHRISRPSTGLSSS